MRIGLLVVLGYLCGSVPFGVVLTKWIKDVDVRNRGSGNIGATNVARVAGKQWGVLVLILDAAKGAVPVWLSLRLAPQPAVPALVGLAAVLGHVFPPWLGGKGGKGVATAFGVLSVIVPWSALAGFGAYALMFAVFRVSSIGSLVGGLVAAVTSWLTARCFEYAVLASLLFALMLITHRGNIRRLLQRSERRI